MSGKIQKPTLQGRSASTMTATAGQTAPSPLKIFGYAKKSIRDIFTDLSSYVKETIEFSSGINDDSLLDQSKVEQLSRHTGKISNIKEMLSRDHMKVVFFGRTSNGKSTVINSMLRSKILPSGIGHTTHCFVQVEGTDSAEGYLTMEGSNDKRSVQSLKDLANALSSAKVVPNTLIRICWPREKCQLLKDDIVLVDSPGIDVSPDLDTWIDKFCLDADVFILVANAESTLMQTEKNFFLRVSDRLSQPTVFILNNRWDASASEPEMMEEVKAQHMERNIEFLCNELKVTNQKEALERIFFVSAKETLHQRLTESGLATTPISQALDGYQTRLFEFANFEKIFQECLSRSAVKTKFAQHANRGKDIVSDIRSTMETVLDAALSQRDCAMASRNTSSNRLTEMERTLSKLTVETESAIRTLTDSVERKVSQALSDEIKRLYILVDDFTHPFHTHSSVLTIYKKELNRHVEEGLAGNVEARCSEGLNNIVQLTRQRMAEQLTGLLPDTQRTELEQKRQSEQEQFTLHYRLDAQNLCANFQEDIEFRFSMSPAALLSKYFGRKMPFCDRFVGTSATNAPTQRQNEEGDDFTQIVMTYAPYLASGSTLSIIVSAGAVWKFIGWKILSVVGGVYGSLYVWERMMWSNRAKERAFKAQYVRYASTQLKQIIDLTSSNAGHQVNQELSTSFKRLVGEVSSAKLLLQAEITELDENITNYEAVAAKAKILRNKAGWLANQLNEFISKFIEYS